MCENSPRLTFLSLDKNVGKGEAIRAGFFFIQNVKREHDFVGYLDADLATPLNEVLILKKVLD